MTTRDALAILRQFRKGTWTNDPSDPNYESHWRTAQSPAARQPGTTVPGVAVFEGRFGRTKQPVNLREVNGQVFIDTPRVEAVGPVGRAAAALRRAQGLEEPIVYSQGGSGSLDQPFTVQTSQGEVRVTPNPAVRVGRPADLPPRDQVSNMWHFLRGK